MLEESPVGDEGRANVRGGGVADIARGEEWLDGKGERAGDEGLGERCSVEGLAAFRGDGRYRGMWWDDVEESSTSCRRDDKKLGPTSLTTAGWRVRGEVRRKARPRCEEPTSAVDGERTLASLTRLLLIVL